MLDDDECKSNSYYGKKTRLPETLGVGVELDLDGARFCRREDRGRRRGSDRGNDGDAAPVVGPAPDAVVVVDVVDVDVDEGVAGGRGELLVLPLSARRRICSTFGLFKSHQKGKAMGISQWVQSTMDRFQ